MRAATSSRKSSRGLSRNSRHDAMYNVRGDIHAVKADLGRLKSDAVGVVSARAESVLNHARENLDTAMELTRQAQATARAGAKRAAEVLAERPVTSVLIALGIGAVIGRFVWKR